MIVYLVRHTKIVNSSNVCYGQSEMPIADSYKEELSLIQDKLPTRFDRCFSSPSLRCKQLAEDLFPGKITYTNELLEINFGDWEQKPWDSINQAELRYWTDNFVDQACPGGESFLELHSRVSDFWKQLKPSASPVLLVTHGGVIRSMLAHISQTALRDSFSHTVNYGAVLRIDYDNPTDYSLL